MRWLVCLYPQRWRNRYGAELEAMLEQTRPTPRIVLDLVAGALDAHLHSQLTLEGVVVHNPFTRTSAALPQTILLPGLVFLAAAVLKYGFGQGFLFDPLEGFFAIGLVEAVTVLSPVVALLLSAAALFEVRLERGEDAWSGTITVKRRYGHIVVLVIGAALTLTFVVYGITENYMHVRID
ncbi:MAG: hypothetical protein M3346_04605 [Actinomycetota bacterium]|nr:hypothetical protein [Actinomycetota bacterium]